MNVTLILGRFARHRRGAWRRTVLAALLISVGANYSAAAPIADRGQASQVPAQSGAPAGADCGCVLPYREYTRKPTPDVLALFEAARHADEATFTRLIATIPELQEYAVDGQPLLAALLSPVEGLVDTKNRDQRQVWWAYTRAETQALRERHRATIPAKTRMLALAIKHGASVKDTSYEMRYPPLHLATMFGTPEMVEMLLAAGADPNQSESDRSHTPVEFMLDHEFFTRMTYLPELVEAEDRTRMLLALFKAGAGRPFDRLDEQVARELPNVDGHGHSVGDGIAWPMIAYTTRGAEVMEALAQTGSAPIFEVDNVSSSSLNLAALAGNVGGVRWLKAHAPRNVSAQKADGARADLDAWLAAATWALYSKADDAQARSVRDLILDELLRPAMPWAQSVQIDYDDRSDLMLHQDGPSVPWGASVMHHIAGLGDVDLAERLLKLGAPIDVTGTAEGSTTPLGTAVLAGNRQMVEWLLQHGADPMAGAVPENTPFYLAVAGDRNETFQLEAERASNAQRRQRTLPVILQYLTPEQRQRIEAGDPSALAFALSHTRGKAGAQALRLLMTAGFSAKSLDASVLENVLATEDMPLLATLLDRGLRVDAARARAYPGNDSVSTIDSRLFQAAVYWTAAGNSDDLIDPLLRAGADPNQIDEKGMSAVHVALFRGTASQVDRLLAAGGRLDAASCRSLSDPVSALEWATRSGSEDMMLRVMQATKTTLSDICWAQDDVLLKRAISDDDKAWSFMLANGFGVSRPDFVGPSMAERLVDQMLENPQLPAISWIAPRLTQRLKTLWQIATQHQCIDDDVGRNLMRRAQVAGRDDIIAVMTAAGIAIPTPIPGSAAQGGKAPISKPTAADRALAKRLVGQYYVDGAKDAGAVLRLKSDGRFGFALAGGQLRNVAEGSWEVRNRRVVFRSVAPQTSAGRQPFVLRDGQPDVVSPYELEARVMAYDQPVRGVRVAFIGCSAPNFADWETDERGRWYWPVPFPACQVVLYHPQADRGRAFVHVNPDPDRKAFDFEFVPRAAFGEAEFELQMLVAKDNSLLWRDEGDVARFTKLR